MKLVLQAIALVVFLIYLFAGTAHHIVFDGIFANIEIGVAVICGVGLFLWGQSLCSQDKKKLSAVVFLACAFVSIYFGILTEVGFSYQTYKQYTPTTLEHDHEYGFGDSPVTDKEVAFDALLTENDSNIHELSKELLDRTIVYDESGTLRFAWIGIQKPSGGNTKNPFITSEGVMVYFDDPELISKGQAIKTYQAHWNNGEGQWFTGNVERVLNRFMFLNKFEEVSYSNTKENPTEFFGYAPLYSYRWAWNGQRYPVPTGIKIFYPNSRKVERLSMKQALARKDLSHLPLISHELVDKIMLSQRSDGGYASEIYPRDGKIYFPEVKHESKTQLVRLKDGRIGYIANAQLNGKNNKILYSSYFINARDLSDFGVYKYGKDEKYLSPLRALGLAKSVTKRNYNWIVQNNSGTKISGTTKTAYPQYVGIDDKKWLVVSVVEETNSNMLGSTDIIDTQRSFIVMNAGSELYKLENYEFGDVEAVWSFFQTGDSSNQLQENQIELAKTYLEKAKAILDTMEQGSLN